MRRRTNGGAPRRPSHHWLAGYGFHGCLYDNGPEVFTRKDGAAHYLASVFEEVRGVYTELLRNEYCDLPKSAGVEYCEITRQDCTGDGCEYCQDEEGGEW